MQLIRSNSNRAGGDKHHFIPQILDVCQGTGELLHLTEITLSILIGKRRRTNLDYDTISSNSHNDSLSFVRTKGLEPSRL